MSQLPRTSSKLPPEVYRRRRIAVLVAFILAVALIWTGISFIISWLGGSATPTESTDSLPESSVQVEAGEICPPGTVMVDALVGDAEGNNVLSFGPDETPYIWFTLTNTNSVDCTFNAGAKVQFFTILSGEQTIWTSKQCDRTGLVDAVISIQAGQTISSPPEPWEKVFSSDSGCGPDQEPVITGGASYHLKVDVNGELSSNEQQFVLN